MTEYEKMIAGKLYNSSDTTLVTMRRQARKYCNLFNHLDTDQTFNDPSAKEDTVRQSLLEKLLPHIGADSFIQGPVQVDYGENIQTGENFFANYNLVIMDVCPVTIGKNVFFGPNISLLTPMHPLCYEERNAKTDSAGNSYNLEYGRPIHIGDNCWFGGNVTVIGGVTIGNGCVIGAGSVVTKNIPDNTLAAGNPCRVIREITDSDRMF